jgi:two-component system sensor histidine kinase RegB
VSGARLERRAISAQQLIRHWQTLADRMQSNAIERTAATRNLQLLVALRWLAVGGQILTIWISVRWLGVVLPAAPMGAVILFLIGLNFASLYRMRSREPVRDVELFASLLLDVGALAVQLYLSGGATNPFVGLFLLQVILGAVLLPPRWTWMLFLVTSFCFLVLTRFYRDIGPLDRHGQGALSFVDLKYDGSFLSFVAASVLLILFLARINRNLRERDWRLSDLRQQSAEEEHIVRMGLLASGAAHELGTPLSTLSVIVNDWKRLPVLASDPTVAADIAHMQQALTRCKEIVSRVLLTAGEARAEAAEPTTLVTFLDDVVAEWRAAQCPSHLEYVNYIESDRTIASDTVLRQALFNVLDNALEASPGWVRITADCDEAWVTIAVRDRGPGFASGILADFGKPYQSTKGQAGHGLGLFLVVNVLRKLGGTATPSNRLDGGATIELRFPLEAVSLEYEKYGIG